MKRALSLAVMAAVLLLGMVLGALGVVVVHHDVFSKIWSHHHENLEETDLEQILDLTPDQRREVERILQESEAEVQAIHQELLPRVEAHLRHTHERLLAVLDPEQRKRFDQLHRFHREELEELLLHFRDQHPHGIPGHGASSHADAGDE